MIARQSTAATYPEEQAEQAVKPLAAVRKVLDDKDTPEDNSMDELCLKAGVSSNIYLCGLKISLLEPINQIQHMDEDSEDIYQTSLIDMLLDLINSITCVLLNLLLITRLVADKRFQKMRLVTYCPELKMEKIDEVKASNLRMTLDACTNEREAIIRFQRFNQEKEPSKVYRSKIMLYIPWRDENSDLLGISEVIMKTKRMIFWRMKGSAVRMLLKLMKPLMI